MKKGWLVIVLIVVGVAAFTVWRSKQPDAVVTVIHPHVGTIRAYVEELAVTELPHDELIAMPISGWLERIELREGDAVGKGQVVARLETHDLIDRVGQAEQRLAVLESRIRENQDHRLEENALVEARAVVKAIDETVRASDAKLEASHAVTDFAKSELQRLKNVREADAAADREVREAETEWRRTEAEYRSDALELAALKTIAAVSYIGPKFITDYIDRKTFPLEVYNNQLAEARAELEIEKRNLARAEIKSTIDGVVLERHQTRRQYLAAGTPLLTLGRLEEMEVIAEVLTERATSIARDNPVDVFGEAVGDEPVPAKVSRVYPAGFKKISSLGVEQQRVKVAVALDKRPERLGVAFRVHVRIYHDEATDTLILPRTALFRADEGGWQVMVVENATTTQLQPVEVGLMNDDQVQIVKGLATESAVVAHPSSDIVAGMRVETLAQK